MTACPRCGGLMRQELLGRCRLPQLACLLCGERLDGVILRHRRLCQTPVDRWTGLWRQIQEAVGQSRESAV